MRKKLLFFVSCFLLASPLLAEDKGTLHLGGVVRSTVNSVLSETSSDKMHEVRSFELRTRSNLKNIHAQKIEVESNTQVNLDIKFAQVESDDSAAVYALTVKNRFFANDKSAPIILKISAN